jgi:hypothetical protein
MPLFSERHNIKEKKAIQTNDLDQDSRTSIWNVFYNNYRIQWGEDIDFFADGEERDKHWELFCKIWCDFLKRSVDKQPDTIEGILTALSDLKDRYVGSIEFIWEWWEVYDFLEFLSENDENISRIKKFQKDCNKIMERECLGYRFINNVITPITSKEQIAEIDNAISHSAKEVQIHLEQSLALLSNRENPDFRNSIKESILAVEAHCKIICKEQTPTLTKSLEIIQRQGRVKVHPYLNEAFQKIYSWTNDDEGIRHSLKDQPTVDREDAQFMIITCSAFINYLQVKKMKSESEKP